jgi:hypothetical protein
MKVAQRESAGQTVLPRWNPVRVPVAPIALGLVSGAGLGVSAIYAGFPNLQPLALSSTLATAVVLLLLTLVSRNTAAWQIFRSWFQVGAGTGLFLASVPARRNSPSHGNGSTGKDSIPAPHLESFDPEDEPELEPEDDGEVVLQHVVRVRDASGREYVHATLRGEMEAGERRTTLHLGFCPPLATRPEVEAEIMEGPAGIAKVVQALHNGVQIEVELDEASLEPTVITVEVAASETQE